MSGYAERLVHEANRARFTAVMMVALLASSTALQVEGSNADRVLDWASTNVHNLTHRPLGALVASALVEPGSGWIFELALLLTVAFLLERRIGSLRTLGVFASGHVIAALLTEGWVFASIRLGLSPESTRFRIDVGTSYGMWAMIGALAWYCGRYRLMAAAAAALYLGSLLLVARDMTSTGHVLSLAIGLCWWGYLSRRHNLESPNPKTLSSKSPRPKTLSSKKLSAQSEPSRSYSDAGAETAATGRPSD